MVVFNNHYLLLDMQMRTSQEQHIKFASTLKGNCLLRCFQGIFKLLSMIGNFVCQRYTKNTWVEKCNELQVRVVKRCWYSQHLLVGKYDFVSSQDIGGHSAVPLWTSISATFVGIVLSVNLEFQLSSLLYSGANSHHHHEKLHEKIVSFFFLVMTCPPAAMITCDVTCNHKGKAGSFMRNSYGSCQSVCNGIWERKSCFLHY